MPAVRIGDDNELVQQPQPFKNEYELQEVLADHPILLTGRDDTALVTISREMPLAGGFADIFLIDTDGLPVIALVKLARDGETGRDVTGELCDHLSAVAALPFDEADARSGGLLAATLELMADVAEEEHRTEYLAQLEGSVAANLQAGRIRGIVVIDSAPADLIRQIAYLAEQSDLDLRLLVVERYRLGRAEYFYHSRCLVSGGDAGREARQQRLRFRRAVGIFSKMKPPVFSLRTAGSEAVRVSRDGWPAAVRYTFCDQRDAISLEVQVRRDECPRVAEFLPRLRDHLPTVIPDAQQVELADDDAGWTRLQLVFSEETDPVRIARAMLRLCMTEKDITTLLQGGSRDLP
ncbi:hypothetical protein FGU65_02735 [Methanoculleus sp. FWC-SCC1]|uniref:Uncharacterized protein n=1 Tax=Methanoculleus frigidifontis TaxID=2584085 RepID=A0ABT8M7B4_9EURY|nr:hypothetical protein [Methanoculleus sp. FWC-SCC1]MDN7023820.1 hypothetical protein [Methanoculleus sp. FWC-SCC1]